MTAFENYLEQIGYIKFRLDAKTMCYKKAIDHTISTMVNIDHRYFHKDDPILDKIDSGISVLDGITWEDRANEIVFGLHEVGKPPTLISPRPKIRISRFISGSTTERGGDVIIRPDSIRVFDESHDDSMSVILKEFSPEIVLIAAKDKRIVFEIDLTK